MRSLAVVVGLIIVLAATKAASAIVVPFLLAITLAIAFQPVSEWLSKRGFPVVLASVITVLGVLSFLLMSAWLVWQAAAQLGESLPTYQQKLQAMQHQLGDWLRHKQLSQAANTVERTDLAAILQTEVANGMISLGDVLQTFLMILLITVFVQLEAASYRKKLRKIFGNPRPIKRVLLALKDVQRYLGVQTVLALANGVLLGGWCWMWGISSPVLWGVLAFALNFIPVIGSIIAAIPPILLGLLHGGIGWAVGVASGYVLVNIVVDNILAPRIMGRALGLSPLVILLAMLIWGYVLGPVGALLSVPLTMTVKIMLEHNPELRWVALIIGDPNDDSLKEVKTMPIIPITSPSPPEGESSRKPNLDAHPAVRGV